MEEFVVFSIKKVLREDLCSIADSSLDTRDQLDRAFGLVWQARCDFKVWKNGLDRAYNAFLATKPSPPSMISAVLLSIM